MELMSRILLLPSSMSDNADNVDLISVAFIETIWPPVRAASADCVTLPWSATVAFWMVEMALMLDSGSNLENCLTACLTSLATMDGIVPMQMSVTCDEMFCVLSRFLTLLEKVVLT